MKRGKPVLFAILLFGLFSVGWRLPKSLTDGDLVAPRNMYLYDSLLFVSDSQSGIHIYSIANAAQPTHKLTIPIKGNTGLAVKGQYVFANSYSSLLVMKVYDDTLYKVVHFIRDDYAFGYCCFGDDLYRGGWGCLGCFQSAPLASDAGSGGVGGSYATFAVIDNYLYYIDNSSIITVNITDPEDPTELSRTYIAWSIETLFPTQEYLFIGGTTGMFIFDRTDPANPAKIGVLQHVMSCDPVVVQDTVAFVTLRGGNQCGQSRSVVLSVSVKNPYDPYLLDEEPFQTPYGLAVKDTLLYVSKGTGGFTVFSVADPWNLTVLQSWTDEETKDFIWVGNKLYVMAFSDLKIYDVGDPLAPVLLARIE